VNQLKATPAPKEMSRRFLTGFLTSLISMFLAAIIYYVLDQEIAVDLKAELLGGAFAIIGVLVGWWMMKTGEKHVGLGVIFGSIFGIILIILAVMLLTLHFVAFPAFGR